MRKIMLFILLALPVAVFAEKPACNTTSSGENYCYYTGKLSRLYINEANVMLFYFEEAIDPSVPKQYGISIGNGGAASYLATQNPEFANSLYSTALAALMGDKKVSIQMRSEQSGYLKVDRIWIYK